MNARNAPDNHQVFIGNLPSGISNAEVHDVFGSKKIILCLPSTKNNKHNERFCYSVNIMKAYVIDSVMNCKSLIL